MQVSLEGVWFRQIPAGADPLSRPPEPPDGRWQRSSVVGAIYFGDSPETVWAEWYRWLAEAAIPPAMALPRDLWHWEIDLPRLADMAQADLPALEPNGEQLYADGWPALVSPSAARPEGRVLCIFRTAQKVVGATPLPPPERVSDPPVVPTGLRT